MDLMIADSKILEHIIDDSLRKNIGDDGTEKVLTLLRLREESANNIIHVLNDVIVKAGYALKLKNIFERLGDNLSSRIDVKISSEEISLTREGMEFVNIEVMNRFDVPLIFEVSLEDRDSFLPIVYNKIEGAYFNGFSQENIIDSGDISKFKFKIGWDNEIKTKSTVLFVVIRSKDVEGLNWIGKIRVSFETKS
jgi:hypothetical protein